MHILAAAKILKIYIYKKKKKKGGGKKPPPKKSGPTPPQKKKRGVFLKKPPPNLFFQKKPFPFLAPLLFLKYSRNANNHYPAIRTMK
ncbi:hypothetical protein NXW23_03100 [Bacteroides caccae]|uniref:Uncharacterized protein n=1 Tax=Bacteroides caccae TaxID=47678 RepID=A0AA94YBZ4_9BACE|nr:hypothetical protein NXW23_03100 [Bacteroides caccae]